MTAMATFDPTRFRWPPPWRPLTDDAEALAFGRLLDRIHGRCTSTESTAPTVLGELRRETCDGHPLAGVECRPVAWDPGGKDFLFLTARPDMPVALVHLTFGLPSRCPEWPFVVPYRSLRDFVRRERSWVEEAWAGLPRLWATFARGR